MVPPFVPAHSPRPYRKDVPQGEIQVDGGRTSLQHACNRGKRFAFLLYPDPMPEDALCFTTGAENRHFDADAQMMRRAVIYHDDHLIAINKPAGLPTQGGSGQGGGTLMVWLLASRARVRTAPPCPSFGQGYTGAPHRSRQAAQALTDAFRHRETRARFTVALLQARPPRMGKIRFWAREGRRPWPRRRGEKMCCLHPSEIAATEGAKRAETDYATLSALGGRGVLGGDGADHGIAPHQLRAHIQSLATRLWVMATWRQQSGKNLGDGWGAQLGVKSAASCICTRVT